jgi:hypothetical protein
MKPPKLCRDWKGLRVRFRRHMTTRGGDDFYPSDEMVVSKAHNGWVDVWNVNYGPEDLRHGMLRVPMHRVEIIGPETDVQRRVRLGLLWQVQNAADMFDAKTAPYFDVTDDELDAPDGVRIGNYERRGDQWVRVEEHETTK